MSDKSLTGYTAGEYLQFQKDVVPEVTASYSLGTRTAPFYALHASRVPLTHIQTFASQPYNSPFPPNTAYVNASNQIVVARSTTVQAAIPFSTF